MTNSTAGDAGHTAGADTSETPATLPEPDGFDDTEEVVALDEPLAPPIRVLADLRRPFLWGFVATVGALVAIAFGSAISSLSTVMVWIGVALFIALALDPVVRWLEAHRMSRGLSIVVVIVIFALLVGGLLAWVLPTAITQITQFALAVPGYITGIQNSEWFDKVLVATGQPDLVDNLLNQARTWLSNPANILALGGGALAVGGGVVQAVSGTFFVFVLTLYFLSSLRAMKDGAVRLAPAYGRLRTREFVDGITESVGSYVSGMVILAAINAFLAFLLLLVTGVPFAALLGVIALAITIIPMIGSFLVFVLGTTVALFHSPVAAIIFAVVYAIYMQIEAYVLTPRVMNKAVDIPGSLVLIGALVGGTLLGLLGALIAVPVTASLLMVVQKLFLPAQDAKTVRGF